MKDAFNYWQDCTTMSIARHILQKKIASRLLKEVCQHFNLFYHLLIIIVKKFQLWRNALANLHREQLTLDSFIQMQNIKTLKSSLAKWTMALKLKRFNDKRVINQTKQVWSKWIKRLHYSRLSRVAVPKV